MTKQEILSNVFNKLKFAGYVDSKKTFAENLDYNYTCLSAAMNGEERYLTERLFRRVLRAYPCVNPNYLRSGEGEILVDVSAVTEDSAAFDDIEFNVPTKEMNTYAVNPMYLERFTEELAQQRELTKRAQDQTEKALSQIDQLIEIIKQVTMNR